jgi:hypothetical protein
MIVPTNSVEGNITDCKIETAQIKTDRESPLSLTEIITYRSYDVCTKQTIEEYQIPSLTVFSFPFVLVAAGVGLFLIVCLFSWLASLLDI